MPDLGMNSPGFRIAEDYAKRITVPDNSVQPGLKVIIPIRIPAGAASVDVDVIVQEKMEVTGFYCIKRNGAGAGNTMQLKKLTTAITAALACAVDDTKTEATTVVDTGGINVFLPGETLRVSAVFAAGQIQASCFVEGVIVP